VLQRFGNLPSGRFDTDEQRNEYTIAAATVYMQQGGDALQGFMKHDSPVSGTEVALTMLAGGIAGGVKELGAVTVTASARDIISRTAQRVADGGFDTWKQFLSTAEQNAFKANPSMSSMFAGQAVHRGTSASLRKLYEDRFLYSTKGPDFLDTLTGEQIELTTPGQVGAHMARPGYGEMTYSIYTLPK